MLNLGLYNACAGSNPGVEGLDAAMARFGLPALEQVQLSVTEDTIAERERVRKRRVAEVIMLLERKSGLYLVHTKAFYPNGVYRLISGGIKAGEDLLAAVHRETHEETGLDVCIRDFLAVFQFHFTHGHVTVPFTSFLFHVQETGGVLANHDPAEAITDFRDVTFEELEHIAQKLEGLSPGWIDWGRFRAAPHRFVLDHLDRS
ncbi:MAG: NUDIX hydrolase [Anaerolineae bacterium]|nr:NUDIX hydrolase [Anaerolineae bacterium]